VDYDDDDKNNSLLGRENFIGLLAIQDGTKLVVLRKIYKSNGFKKDIFYKEIQISTGSLFVARGNFIHAGSAYDEKHFRFHFYIENGGATNQYPIDRKTYFLNESLIKLFRIPSTKCDNNTTNKNLKKEALADQKVETKKRKFSIKNIEA
jgi:hypothetical protein